MATLVKQAHTHKHTHRRERSGHTDTHSMRRCVWNPGVLLVHPALPLLLEIVRHLECERVLLGGLPRDPAHIHGLGEDGGRRQDLTLGRLLRRDCRCTGGKNTHTHTHKRTEGGGGRGGRLPRAAGADAFFPPSSESSEEEDESACHIRDCA